jgi:Icc-related predicted phosphoesterase
MAKSTSKVRVAAVADLHYGKTSPGSLQPLFAEVAAAADVLALCGDLTDYGLPDEAHALVKELSALGRVPVVAVLGNHDYESGRQDEIRRILGDGGVTVLDGDVCEVHGVGFAGVKGFGGGFGQRMLAPWGEPVMKQLVREAVEEALKLEGALARLRTAQRVALLHYAPVQATVEGEPPEIFPFLGCSRLEEPLNQYPVNAIFHGHAHHGAPQGRTRGGVPVYNVALSLLRRSHPDRPPFVVIEVPAEPRTKD